MELTPEQQFRLAQAKLEFKSASKEGLELIAYDLMRQNYLLKNFWKQMEGKNV